MLVYTSGRSEATKQDDQFSWRTILALLTQELYHVTNVVLRSFRGYPLYIGRYQHTTRRDTSCHRSGQKSSCRALRSSNPVTFITMDWNAPDLNSWPAKLVLRVGKKLRSNKQFTQDAIAKNEARALARREKIRTEHAEKNRYQSRQSYDTSRTAQSNQDHVNELGEREMSVFSEATTLVDQPVPDHTDMMHRLAHHDSFDSLLDQVIHGEDEVQNLTPRELEALERRSSNMHRLIDALPALLWKAIAAYAGPSSAASLVLTTKALHEKLGLAPLQALDHPTNQHHKIQLLHGLDRKMPRHLLCFACGVYHLRLRPGKESFKADFVSNPLVSCPNSRNTALPRLRLTHGRELPYGWVQLALRGRYSVAHGVHPSALERRWKCKDSGWSHRTRYMVHDNRLLMRVVSQCVAPPASTTTVTTIRHLLYDREEYTPFFSVCAHWKDGDLMQLCKCTLSHVPAPPESYIQQLKKAPKINRAAARPNFIVRGCDWCRPARRCPECPTEYLFEVQMIEDAKDPVFPFKHSLVVTRWSDLGDGSSPFTSPEWVAVKGLRMPAASPEEHSHGEEGEGIVEAEPELHLASQYDSFSNIGRRAVSGIFESHISGSIPGQRVPLFRSSLGSVRPANWHSSLRTSLTDGRQRSSSVAAFPTTCVLASPPCLPPRQAPHHRHHAHQAHRHPRQSHKLAAPARRHPDVVPVLVRHMYHLVGDPRHQRARQQQREERRGAHDELQQQAPASGARVREQEIRARGEEGEDDEPDGHAVQHRHRGCGRLHVVEDLVDLGGPMQRRQVDVLRQRAVGELAGQRRGRRKVRGRRAAGAGGDVALDPGRGQRGVGHGGGREVALAEVEDVHAVEVVELQGVGEGGEGVGQGGLQVGFGGGEVGADLAPDGSVVGRGGGRGGRGVEEALADARGVELGSSLAGKVHEDPSWRAAWGGGLAVMML
nr:hypothetical protein CFP56_22228 [Quercus suber]